MHTHLAPEARPGGLAIRAEMVKTPLVIVTLATMLGPAFLLTSSVPPKVVVHLVVIALSGSIALSVLDHILDRQIDRFSHPARAIPSGRVSMTEAWVITAGLTGVALVSAGYLGLPSLVAVVAVGTIFILAHSPLRRVFPTSLLTNIAGSVALLVPWFAVSTVMASPIWFLLALNFVWDVGNDTLADLKDVDGDERSGEIVTLPIVLGRRRALALVWATVVVAVALGIAVGSTAHLGPAYYAGVGLATAVYAVALRRLGREEIAVSTAFGASLAFKATVLASIVVARVLAGR